MGGKDPHKTGGLRGGGGGRPTKVKYKITITQKLKIATRKQLKDSFQNIVHLLGQ